MFTSEKMVLIHIVFSTSDAGQVADTMVRHGAIQIVDSAKMGDWAQQLEKGSSNEETSEFKNRRERVERLLLALDGRIPTESVGVNEDPWQDMEERIDQVEGIVHTELESMEHINKELNRLDELQNRMEEVSSHVFPLKQHEEYSYLAVETGFVPEKNKIILEKNLESFLHVLALLGSVNGKIKIAAIVLRRDRERLMSALQEAGFQAAAQLEDSDVSSPQLLAQVNEERNRLQEKQSEHTSKIKNTAREHGVFLKSVLLRARRDILTEQIPQYFRQTEKTCLLTGWIPGDKKDGFLKAVRKTTRNRCVVEEIPAEEIPAVISGKMQVDFLHRQDLRVSASRSASLDSEYGPQ